MRVIKRRILRYIADSPAKVDFRRLKAVFCRPDLLSSADLKQILARMIASGDLCYTTQFGRSFIDLSYDRPHRLSEHLIIAPPGRSVPPRPGEWVVRLERGAAFGAGDHPTTRMAARLIDKLLHRPGWHERRSTLRAVDIGTGSGILAIAAGMLGVGRVLGVDTDPSAVYEANLNVQLNRLHQRVEIGGGDFGTAVGPYDLVVANLRTPTLIGFRDSVHVKTEPVGALIFSGMKAPEVESVGARYQASGFAMVEMEEEKGWCAICLTRGSCLNAEPDPAKGIDNQPIV